MDTPRPILTILSLPSELLHQILTHLPASSLPDMRLVSHTFDMLAFPIVFKHIPLWLDYKLSHQKIQELALDLCERPAVIWSPWASEPEGEVQETWLELCWKLMARDLPGLDTTREHLNRDVGSEGEIEEVREGRNGEGEEKKGVVRLTATNFMELSGIEGITEHRLKTGQNRFLLWRMYLEEARVEWEISQMGKLRSCEVSSLKAEVSGSTM